MKILFKIITVIGMIMTITSLLIYFIAFDKMESKMLFLNRAFIFLGIAILMSSYQYEFRHEIMSERKQKTGKVIMLACLFFAVVFAILSVIQFVNVFK